MKSGRPDIPSAGAGIQMTFSIKRSMSTVSIAEGVLIVFVVILGTALIGGTIDWPVFPFPTKHISTFFI
jgi:type IV secretory pathway VirB2 component (pilin)